MTVRLDNYDVLLHDIDGTLLDTLPRWERARQKTAEDLCCEFTPSENAALGINWGSFYEKISSQTDITELDLSMKLRYTYLDLHDVPINFCEGAEELLLSAGNKNKIQALVSAAPGEIVSFHRSYIEEKLGIEMFDFHISLDDVGREKQKPDPACYLHARQKVTSKYGGGLRFAKFEDSLVGTIAAFKAIEIDQSNHCHVVFVPSHEKELKADLFHFKLNTLREVEL
jgi:beta-phosphoglucomutase-like phosphatase (HAD superfamily)